ncbi:MAG: protein kinase domain-containing protein, partial [Thermoguttaceae bacterium]
MNNTPPRSIHETIVERFEAAWLRGEPEPIERLTLDRSDPCYLATLEELVHLELEFTWKSKAENASNSAGVAAGSIPSSPKIEHYFARFPELNVPDIVLRLVRQEYLVRCRFGDPPVEQEYRQRFPEIVSGAGEAVFRRPGNPQQNSASAENDLQPGQEIGRYVLIDEAGRGGFGRVWQVEDTKLGRRIALKQMSDRVAREDDLRRRFITEARISASLEHPGVVPVYDLDQLDERHPYYTMKLVKGETLGEAISRFHTDSRNPPSASRPLEFQKLLGVFVSICRTIEYAHAHNVIHRDLKPQNIILGKYGETIVLDWGLAKVFQPDAESAQPDMASVIVPDWGADQTQPGSVQGTPAYMSPEQADGQTALVSPRTDIYALGVILYQILTGELPFEGDSAIEVLQRVRQGSFSPPRSVKHVVPKPLEAACLKAMARQPEDRYRLVQDLREDIERYLADEAVSVYREPWFARFRRWARRHRTLVAGAIAATAVLLVSLVVGIILLADAAERERAIADRERAARMLAEQKEREANQARQEAVKERDRANENLATAASAVFRFQDGITNSPILQSYGFSDFRRAMLHQAGEFYETLLQKGSKDSRLLGFRAAVKGRLGDVELMTGRYDRAEAAYRAAIDAFELLLENEPQYSTYLNDLALCQDHLGCVYL